MPWRPAKIKIQMGSDGQPDVREAEHVINQLLKETNGRIDDLAKTSGRRINGSANLVFGTIGAGGFVERTFHVPAAHSDLVAHANPVGDPGAGLLWGARITGANQVTIRVSNPTGAPVVVNPIMWKVVVS